jgi:hypothetical protein
MKAMLLAVETRFKMGEAMDSGKVVIINNSVSLLGNTGSEFFGRFFIAQVLAAAQQRAGRNQEDKKPVYFYIDECYDVISRDERIPTILNQCRSQNIAMIMAHQTTNQIKNGDVLAALENCAIRYANSDDEARYLAPKLRTSTEFLQNLDRGEFAAYVRGMTQRAVSIKVLPIDFSAFPTFTPAEEKALKERTRAAYGTRPVPPLITSPPPQIVQPSLPPAAELPQPQRHPPTEDRPTQSTTARPDLPRPAATQADKPSGSEAAKEEWC